MNASEEKELAWARLSTMFNISAVPYECTICDKFYLLGCRNVVAFWTG